MSIQDEKNRIDGEARIKKDEADKQAATERQTAADQEAERIRQEAERAMLDAKTKARQVQENAQN